MDAAQKRCTSAQRASINISYFGKHPLVFSAFLVSIKQRMLTFKLHYTRYYCSKECQLDDWPAHKQQHKSLDTDDLFIMVSKGNWKGVQKLLLAGADPLANDDEGKSALDYASCFGHFKIVELMINSIDFSSDSVFNKLRCSIGLAFQEGQIHIVEILIKAGGKTLLFGDGSSQEYFFSPLHDAAFEGCLELVELLVKIGGDDLLHLQAREIGTCLHIASFQGHLEVVKFLVKAGSQTLLLQGIKNSENQTGNSCLHTAATYGSCV